MNLRFKACCVGLILGLMLEAPQQVVKSWNQEECSKVKFGAKVDATFVDAKARCMSTGEHAVPENLLAEDKKTILYAYPTIRNFYKDKSQEDMAVIVGMAWTKFRWEHPRDQIDAKKFIQLSSSYGQLTVKSDPTKAYITVDSKLWEFITKYEPDLVESVPTWTK